MILFINVFHYIMFSFVLFIYILLSKFFFMIYSTTLKNMKL